MSRQLHLRLTPRLALVFVLFAGVLLVFVGIFAYYSGRNGLETATVSALLSEAVEKEAALDEWILERQSDLAMIAASPRIREYVTPLVNVQTASTEARAARDQLVAELQFTTLNESGFLDVFVMDPESGQVIAATDSDMEGTFRENRPFFIHGKDGLYVQNPYYLLPHQKPVMTLSIPLQTGDGRLLAVLAGHLDLNDMRIFITRRSGLQQTEEAFLVNSEHLFVTQLYLLDDPVVLQRGVHTEAVKRCLDGNSGILFGDDYRNIPAIIAYRWLAERRLCLIVKMDQAEAIAPVQAFGAALAVIGAVALVAASLLSVGLARTITRPILALEAGVARFGRGELDVRLPETSSDELGLLAHEFNVMAASLAEKEQRLIEGTARLTVVNKELEAFSYSVSHDLRAPLRAVDGFSQVLEEDYAEQLDEDGKKYLARIRAASQRMGQLIDDLLELSRLTRSQMRRQEVDLSDMVRKIGAELREQNPDREVEFRVEDGLVVNGDVALLRVAMSNLLNNAWKYTGKQPKPQVMFGCDEGGGQRIYFVRDNGVGFDMEYASKLFGVFQRLHSASEFPGNGIGLATVQRIIHHHGGQIWAESAVDHGATFYFSL